MKKQNKNLDLLINIDARLDSVDRTLIKQEENLKQHMYRTELAEKRLELIESELKPVKNHVTSITAIAKVAAWLIGSGALIALIEFLK